MRLTLRTLLAYRDRVLSQADSEDLHRRIQQSQDAGNLLKRIGAVVHSRQVFAPPVMGKGLGGDPNSIAEYLDDALQHSQVPELEKICLVSDVQLAELAHCHELIATAMHTKVVVPPELRTLAISVLIPEHRSQIEAELKERMIPRRAKRRAERTVRADEPHPTAAAHNTPAGAIPLQVESPMVASGGESINPQGLNLESSALAHEVPEYLVGSTMSGQWRTPLAIGVLVALLVILVWQTLGPWDRVAELLTSNNSAPAASSLEYDLIIESDQIPPGLNGAPKPAAEATTTPATSAANTGISEDTGAPPGLGPTESTEAPPGSTDAPPGLSETPPGLSEAPPGLSEIPPPGLSEIPQPGASEPPPGLPSSPAESSTAGAVWLPKTQEEQQSVLLSQSQRQLRRIAAGDTLAENSMLIVPPFTRTTLDLPKGVLWTVCGPSRLRFVMVDDSGVATVETTLCRGLVRGGPESNKVALATPAGNCILELDNASSMASVEFNYRPIARGFVLDPSAFAPALVIVAVEGGLSVQTEATGEQPPTPATKLSLGEGLAFLSGSKPKKFTLQTIPGWFQTSIERPIDGLAALDLGQLLTPTSDAPDLSDTLNNLCRHRRPETAALATQLSLLADRWEPFIDGFLNNDRLRSHWNSTLSLARQLLATNPTVSDRVRQLFRDRHGDDGEILFSLLIGLSPEQLQTDGIAKLVQQLESPRLDNRVLAAYQLQRLTGKNLGFQPHAPNRASIQTWRRELATERLQVLTLADPITERIPR